MKIHFDKDDEKFEAQLRQFRPQPPRALTEAPSRLRSHRRIQMAMVGVAAAILVAVVLLAVRSKAPESPGNMPVARQTSAEPVTLGQLRRFADDPAQLDSRLDSLSHVLPDVHRKGGVLSKLAQEAR